MKATYFEEPELEFSGGRHIDIRFGLSTFGALDRGHSLAPSKIRLGIVGDQESIDKFTGWVGKCRSGIDSKTTALPTLFPTFPGFGNGKPFCDAICDSQLTRSINSRDIRALATLPGRDDVIRSSVDRYIGESHDLCQNAPCDVVVCLVPAELLKPIDTGAAETSGPRSRRRRARAGAHVLAWHDLLKARSMGLKVPVQMVRPATYGGKVHRYRKDGKAVREIEDEATRAWNFFTALYYKAGGVPWRLQRRSTDYDACFVGISYYHEITGENVQTSVAQVFNERGEGIVIRGGHALVQKPDKTTHLDAEKSSELLANALSLYKREHKNLPARIVCHKSSYFDEGELRGFEEAAVRLGIEQIDLLSIRRSSVRFFRDKPSPPLRGTSIQLDDRRSLLYTQGSVDFYRAYPGLYIPRPIEVLFDQADSSELQLLPEILALTKMNWNSTRFVNSEPITISASRNVGDVLRYLTSEDPIQARYSFYM